MARVTLADICKVYPGDVRAVDGFSLDIADEEFVALVGPSGCGKSTTLRMIAGLEEVTSGTIEIGGRVVNDVPPKDRDIAMVFQNYALYPHMTAYENLAFSLKMRKRQLGLKRAEIDQKVRETARLLGVEDLLKRRPKELSGGQRQRVAVGRAIVRNPKAFLFDEPLSNLDAKMRLEMRTEIKRLQRRLRSTTVYVTHDQEEAMTLGDRVVVMKDGHVQQCATPMEVYEKPVNRFVAGFIGTPSMSFLEGTIVAENGRIVFDEGSQRLPLPGLIAEALADSVGSRKTLGIRPEAFRLDSAPASAKICPQCGGATIGRFCHGCGTSVDGEGRFDGGYLDVTVTLVELLGDVKNISMATATHRNLVGRVDAKAPVVEGCTARVYVEPRGVHVFEPGEMGMNVSAVIAGAAASAN